MVPAVPVAVVRRVDRGAHQVGAEPAKAALFQGRFPVGGGAAAVRGLKRGPSSARSYGDCLVRTTPGAGAVRAVLDRGMALG